MLTLNLIVILPWAALAATTVLVVVVEPLVVKLVVNLVTLPPTGATLKDRLTMLAEVIIMLSVSIFIVLVISRSTVLVTLTLLVP